MDTPKLTICPSAPERLNSHFDCVQFALHRSQQPVEARYVGPNNGDNGWSSTGISYDDYSSMQTQKKTKRLTGIGTQRRLDTPEYMQDAQRFRAVVIRYLELRAQARTDPGTEVERLQQLTILLKRQAKLAAANLDKFCAMYVVAGNDAERRRCQRRIEEYDTAIRLYREPWIIPQMARAYYFEKVESAHVGLRFGFKAPHVRQILHRLKVLDEEMQVGSDFRTDHIERGKKSAHTRCHTNRGIISPDCAYCAQDAQNLLVGARQDAGNQSQHVSAS